MDANVDTVLWVRSRLTLHDITWVHNNLTCGTNKFADAWAPMVLLTCGTHRFANVWDLRFSHLAQQVVTGNKFRHSCRPKLQNEIFAKFLHFCK